MSVSRLFRFAIAGLVVALAAAAGSVTRGNPRAADGPVLVVETVKGTFEIQTYPDEAPKTVEHILALV